MDNWKTTVIEALWDINRISEGNEVVLTATETALAALRQLPDVSVLVAFVERIAYESNVWDGLAKEALSAYRGGDDSRKVDEYGSEMGGDQ
jgi:hypothetical protein